MRPYRPRITVEQDAHVGTGQRSTWEDVYRTESTRLWRSLLLLTGDGEMASDAMAEAFAQGIARGDDVRSPGAWVWKAAFMIARGDLADRKERGHGAPDVVEPESYRDEVIDVLDALRNLSPMQRSAVILHHFAGYTLREVAVMLGSSRSAVGVHLFRARTELRRSLGDSYG